MSDTLEVLNVNHPAYRGRVNAAKYTAMKSALLAVLRGSDGLSQMDIKDAVKPHLPQDLFPQGKAAGWWAKTVQLDLEARGKVRRSTTKPLGFFLT